MNGTTFQRGFLPMFAMLLAVDYFVQLAQSSGVVGLEPLLMLWSGPLDDIFYGLAGVQALYFLVDPRGESRDEKVMSFTATVKRIASLLSQPRYLRAFLPKTFLTGSLRCLALLGDALIAAIVAHKLLGTDGFAALLVLLQRHLSFVLPIACLGGLLCLGALQARIDKLWFTAVALAGLALLCSMAYDGRWSHHVHHLFASLSNLQAWGAAACWIGAGAAIPSDSFAVEPYPCVRESASLT